MHFVNVGQHLEAAGSRALKGSSSWAINVLGEVNSLRYCSRVGNLLPFPRWHPTLTLLCSLSLKKSYSLQSQSLDIDALESGLQYFHFLSGPTPKV